MNGPFVVAQANTAHAQDAPKKPVIVKVTKPSDGQAITVELSHDQRSKSTLRDRRREYDPRPYRREAHHPVRQLLDGDDRAFFVPFDECGA